MENLLKRLTNNPILIIFIIIMLYSSIESGLFNDPKAWFFSILFMLPGLIIGISFHEFAHAAVAYKLGDNTPKIQGRVTLNPIKHVDIFGLMALFIIGFGWGKAVQINSSNFKKPRRDEFLVSIAGVTLNFIIAFIFVGLFIYLSLKDPMRITIPDYLYKIIYYIIWINLVLMIFNLLPVPPLDGFNIVTSIFNLKRYSWWYELYNKGMLILLVLIFFNITSKILVPAIYFIIDRFTDFWLIIL